MRRAPFDDDTERFDWKADNFILKPVDLQELEARCRALLHRYHSAALSKVQFGNLTLDKVAKQVSVEGRPVGLNGREFQLLELLLANPHRAVDKQELMDRLFGVERLATSNALELYISRLRRKLAGASILIRTVRGFGYSAEIQAEPCNLTASGTVATTA
jgi:two-component system, OmpR family, response regulator TctD